MPVLRVAVFLALMSLLAGCSQSADRPGPEPASDVTSQSDNAPTTSSSSEDQSELDPSPESLVLILNECIELETLRIVPSEIVGAKPPPGWASSPTPMTELRIEISECQRISIGPFERGPVHFLVEIHDNREPPEACRGDYTSSEVITQVWVDDQELVTYFVDELGLPAKLGTFQRLDQTINSANKTTWTFSSAGFPASSFETIRTRPADTAGMLLYRRFWANNAGGISFMDFETRTMATNGEWPIATGTVAEPFLHLPGDTSFVGISDILDPSSISAPIQRFGDFKCEQPY
jgi:hypothetical protein